MSKSIGVILQPDKQMFLEDKVKIMENYMDRDKFIMLLDSRKVNEALDDYMNSISHLETINMFIHYKEPAVHAIRTFALVRGWDELLIFKDQNYDLYMKGFQGFTNERKNSALDGYISFIDKIK